MADMVKGSDFGEAALEMIYQKGMSLGQSIRTGLQETQLKAYGLSSSVESSPVSSKIQGLRNFAFPPVIDKPDTIPEFILPTRESISPEISSRRGRLLKDFGSINPALYQSVDGEDTSFPEDHIGRLWFQLTFERDSDKLIVTIVKAKNIPLRPDKSHPDPFVRLCLLPDERRSLQTKVKRKTCNPRFDEVFIFPVSVRELSQRILRFSVFDIDRRRKHILVGHIVYPLSEFDFKSCDKHSLISKDLFKDSTDVTPTAAHGELLISLCYNENIERLTVNVVEAKGLPGTEAGVAPDSYVKVCLMRQNKIIKSNKTQIVKRTCDPSFNESFQFKLSSNMSGVVSLLFLVEAVGALRSKKVLGRVTLGGFMFSRGKDLEHWQEMMQTEKTHVQRWHPLI